MNAPLPEAIRKALESASLDDKYSLDHGRAFMSGVQALVRLPMLQRQRDLAAGLNTGGFVSGYRGSPLGGYDQALWAAQKHLAANHIVFQPGVNEELGATAVWGTQQLDLYPQSKKYDGVFGIWYGKGPGVDRCSDVFKHANMAGTAKHGGVIAIAGDDHVAKSSTAAHQSDHIFKACGLPVFFPSSVQDILDMGLHAFAMSRYAGVWTGMKTIQEVVESSASVSVDPDRVKIVLPEDFTMPPGGLHIRWPDAPLEQEARLFDHKWYAALAYVRANRLNHNVIEGPNDRFGIIASGKAYNDTRQALADLGLDDARCRELGIRLHKVNVVWPLDATITREFAQGLQEILVVEEKRQVIEYQIKEELYNWRPDVRPNVLGKFDEPEGDLSGGEWSMPNPSENWLLRAKADLTPAIIAKAIAKRLKKLGFAPEGSDTAARMDQRLDVIAQRERAMATMKTDTGERAPWFCSGCPHNTSTRVPEGSRAMAGIGCHYMSVWMDRSTSTFSQMGGEGVAWVGQAPFTKDAHVFANLGDGTYFHSGLLAIRQSVAAGVNITYKVLYNDAVAMTGGQQVGERPEGHSVLQIQKSLIAEGVKKLVIVSDEPQKYDGVALEPGITVHHRDELDAIQRQLREIPGCTAIIYDQTCATEKRRRRKRGKLATPAKTVVINELVCEGCGDCSVQSNCLSVEPVETEFGRKRRINQNTCNKDYTCVKGFCPSFVTVEGGTLKKAKKEKRGDLASLPPLPEPSLPLAEKPWGIVVGGVGGTGVITIGQLLGVAAHLEGRGVVTQDAGGLAQKGGATWSHIQIANRPEAIHTTKVDTAKADLVIACDAIVGAGKYTMSVMREGRTFVALNTHGTPTAAFVRNPDWQFPGGSCEAALAAAVGAEMVGGFDAEQAAVQLVGDSIYTNPLLLGYAWQKGRLPLGHAALMRAFELNGVQVENNKAAFEWGRRCAHDLAAVQALYAAAAVIEFVKKPSLDELVARRAEFLTGYQDAAYAAQYKAFVDKVRAAEAPLASTKLAEAVARYLFKLMAYKDEYEVARLHTDPAFTAKIAGMFEGDVKLTHHLAPPLLAKTNDKGELIKKAYGPWMRTAFGLLAKMKGLRGTALDPFARTEERKTERALIGEYRECIEELLRTLSAANLAQATEIARIPEEIRGFGHVKARHLAAARGKWATLMAQWRAGGPAKQAA
ncbi:MAG: indolepyruvate ferredoxin oxidoreductase family protein [Piscinibacter sp.]|uniref:indolepyruvate ferredoxin oxidoreductase family protein n=1 Tax=Piscinibacter sp. TaxID=1903157 RepID=UPI001B6EDF03|nr:indolepyruvate ferredoxin oxidoreductase family protein [Piscinibacter sp.]MBP5990099.1 indolepyruvate ferredoxin oxidoreductase family protein [Piscinibacter sp.]MBP6027508.1 indolepyruvate ferredoxin oxidoreductase family protein [Piscinibacter sp.]